MEERSYSSIRHHHHHRHRRDNHPSFSSSLLDSIYRSIDGEEEPERDLLFYRETIMRKKQPNAYADQEAPEEDLKMANYRRACIIEKWMEKKVAEKKVAVVRRCSSAATTDFEARSRRPTPPNSSSATTSSESSSGGGFSSSESESLRRRPKPIRTSLSSSAPEKPQLFDSYVSRLHHHHHHGGGGQSASAPAPAKPSKHENGFVRTKSKALKIYGDLKKVRQPISPGGKLASFLNSLFTNAGKKPKPMPPQPLASNAVPSTACSSASSFSRSCLSNTTPSSRGNNNNNKFSEANKRSVRFGPASVVVDEDFGTVGHKSLEDAREQVLVAAVIDDRRRVQEVAIDLLKSYQKKSSCSVEDFDMSDVVEVVRVRNDTNEFDNDDEDDDDAASYASSDLFELDNLSSIGSIERYREELPVYETTHFDTNRAIANGFIL